MKFELGLAQTTHPLDGDVIAMVRRYAQQARMYGVDLLVFPESLMTPFNKDPEDYRAVAEAVGGPYTTAINAIAAEYGVWMIYTMLESSEENQQPFNTALVVDDHGIIRGTYRKVHLFDTEQITESDRVAAGSELFQPLETPFGTIGLGICYDLRFPEMARIAARQGCELMIYTSAWLDGPHKVEHWRTLLQARAIENEFYVAGLSRCDPGYVGQSCIVDPWGNIIEEGGRIMELIIATIDTDEIASAREAMPILAHVRNDVYEKAQ